MKRNVSSPANNVESEVMSVSGRSSPRVTSSEKDADEIVNEMLARRLWPWPIAVAYCLETGKRRQAVHDAAKVLTSYPYEGKLGYFTAMIAIEYVFQVHVGASDLPLDWEVMAELESLLLRGVESDDPAIHIPSYGSKIVDGDLVAMSINDWVGSEILCSETADLIKAGFRVPELRETSVPIKHEPVTRFFNVHLSSKHVMELVERQSAKISTPPPLPARWQKQKATPQQVDLFAFLEAAKSGVDTKNATQLRAAYVNWLTKNRKDSLPLERNRFETWLGRYKSGVHLVKGKWVEL